MITNSQNTLLELISNSVFQKKNQFNSDIEWDKVFEESKSQAVTLLTWDVAGLLGIPEQIKKSWQNNAISSIYQNTTNHFAHTYLHKLMIENSIPYCVLKGCSSAYYYPNLELRVMGDVDFLIRKEDIDKTTKVLETAGF